MKNFTRRTIILILLVLSISNNSRISDPIKFAPYEYKNILKINKVEKNIYAYEKIPSLVKEKKLSELLQEIQNIDTDSTYEWFVRWKDLTNKYSKWQEPPLTIYDCFSEDDLYIMHRCIETETFEQDFDSKCNVASIILNRIYNEGYSDIPYEVITQPSQFAYGRKNITDETKIALEYVFVFGDTTNGCLAFRSDTYPDTWHDWTLQFIDKAGHAFYK